MKNEWEITFTPTFTEPPTCTLEGVVLHPNVQRVQQGDWVYCFTSYTKIGEWIEYVPDPRPEWTVTEDERGTIIRHRDAIRYCDGI